MSTKNPSDADLVRSWQAGDTAALGTLLLDRWRRRLLRHITRTVQAADAEDVLQQLWIRLATRADRFDGVRRFAPWLYRVAENLARDCRRRRHDLQLDVLTAEAAGLLVGESDPDPAEAADRRELLDIVWSRVADLSIRYRLIVELRFGSGLSYSAIAARVGIPVGTVKSRLHKALDRLREAIEG